MERAGVEFHNRVRNGYLEIAKNEPERVKVVDGTMSVEEVFEKVKNTINKTLQK